MTDQRCGVVAIVGRPNVGKSTLINKLLGEERMLASDVAGTTRDSIDTTLVLPPDPKSIEFAFGALEEARLLFETEDPSEVNAEEAIPQEEEGLWISAAEDDLEPLPRFEDLEPEESYDEYLGRVGKQGAWGSQLELVALCRRVGANAAVAQAGCPSGLHS